MKATLILAALAAAALSTGCTMPDPEKLIATNEPKLQAAGIETPQSGDPAPAFSAMLASGPGVDFDPATLEPGARTLLFFYPAPFTPNSTAHLQALSRDQARLTAVGIDVYAITTATPEELLDYAAAHAISVPLLADDGSAARAYGVLAADGRYPQRTSTGIDNSGNLRFYERSALPANRIIELFGLSGE